MDKIDTDRNKRMKTVYNYLNLPARVSYTITPANKIEYVYTSAGEKLKQRLSTGATLLYFGNYVYTLDGSANGIVVKYILNQEGRATYSAGAYTYEYFVKDHFGNTRVSFNVPSTTAVIVQQSDYYPFGMIHLPQATTTSDNRHLYNSKELQNNLLGGVNLDIYDYNYRFYNPQIARFNSIDRLASDYPYKSPYDYAENRPVNGIDLDGLEWVNATGKGQGPVTEEYAKKKRFQLLPGFKTESQSAEEQNQQVLQQAAELFPTDNTGTSGTIRAIDPIQNYIDFLSATSPVSYSDGAGMIPSLKAGVEALGFIESGYALTKTAIKLTEILSVGEKVAKTSTQFTKSSLSLGHQMHIGYKAGLAD